MWSLLIKVASLGKGALVVSVAASAVMVSSADLATGPAHHDAPPALLASAATTTTTKTELAAPVAKPITAEPKTEKSEKIAPKTEPKSEPRTERTEPKTEKTEQGKGHDAISGVVKECIEKYLALRAEGDAASKGHRQSTEAVCKAALELTGLTSAEFWAKFGHHTDPHSGPTTTAPKTESPSMVRTLENWIKECVTKYTIKAPDASEFCRKAIELTGLTSSEFAAKYLHQTTTGTTTPPVTTPKPVTNTAELSQLVAKCVQLYTAVTQKMSTDTRAASEACGIAIRASGLTSAQFAAKYFPTQN